MVDPMRNISCDWDMYETPSNAVLKNRRAFYNLLRRRNEPIKFWWERVQSGFLSCEFPIFTKFLLIDRFFSGLNHCELEIIQSLHLWTLEKVVGVFLNENTDLEHNESNLAEDEYIIPNEIIPLDIVKSEPVREFFEYLYFYVIEFCTNANVFLF